MRERLERTTVNAGRSVCPAGACLRRVSMQSCAECAKRTSAGNRAWVVYERGSKGLDG